MGGADDPSRIAPPAVPVCHTSISLSERSSTRY
jgi:hypothetical protein